MTELTFETAQQELEQIVDRLERGNANLEEAIKLWERGEELLRFCLARLETAEGKIEELAPPLVIPVAPAEEASERHDRLYSEAGRRIRLTARTISSHRLVCASSCLRPFGVSR